MQFSLILWSIWGVVFLFFVIVKIYIMRLSREEDDQLVLHEGVGNVQAEQAIVMGKLAKIEPVGKALLWAVIGLSLIVVAYYAVDMVRQLQ